MRMSISLGCVPARAGGEACARGGERCARPGRRRQANARRGRAQLRLQGCAFSVPAAAAAAAAAVAAAAFAAAAASAAAAAAAAAARRPPARTAHAQRRTRQPRAARARTAAAGAPVPAAALTPSAHQRTRLLQHVRHRADHDHLSLLLGHVQVVLRLLAVHRIDPWRQVRVGRADARALEYAVDEGVVLVHARLRGGGRAGRGCYVRS